MNRISRTIDESTSCACRRNLARNRRAHSLPRREALRRRQRLQSRGQHVPSPPFRTPAAPLHTRLSLAPPPPAGHPPTPDKASIFGSALLVPTPEGERARRELAVAGEIERVLHRDPSVVGVRVSLRLATPCSAVTRRPGVRVSSSPASRQTMTGIARPEVADAQRRRTPSSEPVRMYSPSADTAQQSALPPICAPTTQVHGSARARR